jgi:hypothetical protein
MIFNNIPIPHPKILIVREIITFTMLLSLNSGEGFVEGHKDYMCLSVLNFLVLCFTRGNQDFKCWMVLGCPRLL